ncbi:P-type conjugative transfer protein TrbG [Verminephrobacter aporrectodeae subsp. tuberculatae]|nr:P-type conjugative transfer protein TrbG [Verminephrobacter aporrectodeae subsp. tuberculatae]MCW8203994.1 P-type conjugative transfer protein TrbG [Verminephrobacter aporrectodeae subsp. tuberculatae]
MIMKNTKWMAGFLATSLVFPIFAQTVPALTPGAQEQLPPIPTISNEKIQLDDKEIHGVRLAEEWKMNPDQPRRGEDGSVKYLFGATLPTLVCTPLQVCSIRLQPGEVVNDVHAGDTTRWKITPATEGRDAETTTLIIVKPTNAGLTTNLIVTTDRRVYTIKLASMPSEWIPVLSFDYPDDMQRQWAAHRAQQARTTFNNTLTTGQNVANLDFNFHMSGDSPSWRPLRVYSDGSKTYIQFPSSTFNDEAPALVALGNDGEQLVNYRVIGDRYVVDKVLDRAALIVGVGRRQTKVEISRGGRQP